MTGPSVVTVGLTKVYDDKPVVDRLDLQVMPGEFFGFLGPNGAGKTTTIKMLTGLLRPTAGQAIVLGHDVTENPVQVKSLIGALPEEANTYERLTGAELLEFTGRMHGLARDTAVHRADQLLNLMEFEESDRHKMVVDYSMGMRKKTMLACALIHGPRVLFLDEPFNGIDTVTTQALRRVLIDLASKGVTIFFSSHVMEVVEKLCTRLAIIHQGALSAVGTLDEIRAQFELAPDVTLDELFVHIVGGRTERGGIAWMD